MGEVRDNVRRNLGYYLLLRDMSQKELAERLEVSQSAVTNWIKGKNSPDIEVLAQICEILGVSLSDLFGVDEMQEKSPPAEAEGDKEELLNLIDSLSEQEAKLLFEFVQLLLRAREAGK